MTNNRLKKDETFSKNWVNTLNSLKIQQKNYFSPQNGNLYAYAANNPVHYIDPDGRIQRKADRSVVFYPRTDIHKEIGNSKSEILVQWGFIKANDGRDISIRINLSEEYPYENCNCHGYTFTNGLGWVEPNQVETILKGDNYEEQASPTSGGIFVQYDDKGEAYHSGKIQSVDEVNGTITVKEVLGVTVFINEDGKVRKSREYTYKISEMGNVKFYKNEGDKQID